MSNLPNTPPVPHVSSLPEDSTSLSATEHGQTANNDARISSENTTMGGTEEASNAEEVPAPYVLSPPDNSTSTPATEHGSTTNNVAKMSLEDVDMEDTEEAEDQPQVKDSLGETYIYQWPKPEGTKWKDWNIQQDRLLEEKIEQDLRTYAPRIGEAPVKNKANGRPMNQHERDLCETVVKRTSRTPQIARHRPILF